MTRISPEVWSRLSSGLTLATPATLSQISEEQRLLDLQLPAEYREFLEKSNGAEGMVGKKSYVSFWPVNELKQLNHAYEVGRYAPGYLFFGSDGGGEAFAFDTTASMSIVKMLFVGMSRDIAIPQAETFWQLLERLFRS